MDGIRFNRGRIDLNTGSAQFLDEHCARARYRYIVV
jgi:hypothetical protein